MSNSMLDIPPRSSGAVNYGDIMTKVQVRPTPAMLDQAAQAGVPGGNGYGPGDDYDAIAVALYWAGLGYKVMPLKSPDEIRSAGDPMDQAGKVPAFKGKQYVDVWKNANELGKAAGQAAIQLCEGTAMEEITIDL